MDASGLFFTNISGYLRLFKIFRYKLSEYYSLQKSLKICFREKLSWFLAICNHCRPWKLFVRMLVYLLRLKSPKIPLDGYQGRFLPSCNHLRLWELDFFKNIRIKISCRIRRKFLSDKNFTYFRLTVVAVDRGKIIVRIYQHDFWLTNSEQADLKILKNFDCQSLIGD